MTASMIVVIAESAMVAIMIVIPFVTVFEAAAGAVPIAGIVASSLVAWTDPVGAAIRRAAPIALVPTVVARGGIPIAANPDEFGPGLRGNNGDHAWLGRRANSDSHRDLCFGGNADQEQRR
jgi:hypothetical protein